MVNFAHNKLSCPIISLGNFPKVLRVALFIEEDFHGRDSAHKDSEGRLWEVFVQSEIGTPHEHAGSVHAQDAEMALQNARDVYARRGNVTSIWLVPSDCITATTPSDTHPFFDPADDKVYRHPQFYKIPKAVKSF